MDVVVAGSDLGQQRAQQKRSRNAGTEAPSQFLNVMTGRILHAHIFCKQAAGVKQHNS